MEKVRPWCGQPSDRRRLKNRTEHDAAIGPYPERRRKITNTVDRPLYILRETMSCLLGYLLRPSAFFVKEYFPVPSSGGNQCKNRHARIWHFG